MRLWVVLWSGFVAVVLTSCETAMDPYRVGTGYFDTVIIDAGHGGHDRGARSVRGLPEKAVALDVALRLEKILQSKGYRVIMTRRSDYFVTLGRRVDIAKKYRNAIFVSIHFNWAKRRGARGMENFYHSPRSYRLANSILRETLSVYRTPNRGVKKARFYVLRNNVRPAVLLELGFLSNAQDNNYAQNPAIRQKLAEQIARGIERERNMNKPLTR